MADNDELSVFKITSVADPMWSQWKAIYDASFDPCERLPHTFYAELLEGPATRDGANAALLAAELPGQHGCVIGMADVVWHAKARTVLLRYFATKEECRGRGIGRTFYRAVLDHCRRLQVDLMILEVEIPRIMAARSEVKGDFARRRIQWYHRQGAMLLGGIRYQFTLPGGPSMQMHLMVHTFREMTPREAYSSARAVFGDALDQTGELFLDKG